MKAGEFLSIREFAKEVNVSEGTVRKAIKSKKITKASMDISNPKRPKINLTKGRAEWAKNFTPEKIQSPALAKNLTAKTSTQIEEPEPTEKEDGEDVSEEDEAGEIIIRNKTSYAEALRIEKVFKAKTAQCEYNKMRNKLLDKELVDKEYFAIAQTVRSALQGVPDKIIDHILAAGDRAEAHKLLYNEITEALEGLSINPQYK